MTSRKISTAIICFFLIAATGDCVNQVCPFGQYTKGNPSAEKDLKTCKQYACNSCCTAEITEQLVKMPLQEVGGLNYTQCGALTPMCSQFISYSQCFYQCSPNLTPWLDKSYRFMNLPICAEYCDNWYTACSIDQTCVVGTDWARGFKVVKDLERDIYTQQCKDGAKCRNFSEVYSSGEDMCNKMWSGIVYTEGPNCINPADMAHNVELIKEMYGDTYDTTLCDDPDYADAGLVIGVVIGVLAGMALIGALVYMLVTNKKRKEKETVSAANELEDMAPSKE